MGLEGTYGIKARCAKRGCHFMAIAHSMHCKRHQERQEIEDRHGPIIEERATEGVLSKVFAKADKDDDILVAEVRQERAGEIPSLDAERKVEDEEALVRKVRHAQANVERDTKAELESAIRVPLRVAHRQVFSINNVKWILEEGMNSVPWQIKEAYEEHQQMLRQGKQFKGVLKIAENATDSLDPKSHAYYEHVLKGGYRGEETKTHIKRSRM